MKKALSECFCLEKIKKRMNQGMLPCAWIKASYTLEAAVLLPLVTGFLVFLLFFFRVMQVESVVQSALCESARKVAVDSVWISGENAQMAAAGAYVYQSLEDERELINRYVFGKRAGIVLLRSSCEGEYVELRADYRVQFPLEFFSFAGVNVTSQSKSRKWTGIRDKQESEDPIVYIAKTGEVYHRKRNCTYLDLSVRCEEKKELPALRNKSGNRYRACENCGNIDGSLCYVTDYGERYHTTVFCPGLKRTVYMKYLSEVVDSMRGCSKCSHDEETFNES